MVFLLKGIDLIVNIRWYDQPNKIFHSETAAWLFGVYGRGENTFNMIIHLAENEKRDYI